MPSYEQVEPSLLLAILFGALGLAVGSFLNVLALRSLQEESILSPPSYCPNCKRSLGITELIPVFSYFLQRGKCKHCKQPIAWFYPVVELATGVLFVVCLYVFGLSPQCLGMLFFGSTLIAVTVTDFKEKLIPHEITYPAILLGIVYSTSVRNDFSSTLAGIGVSYILFDFLAFYGLKLYFWMNKPELIMEKTRPLSMPESITVKERGPTAKTTSQLKRRLQTGATSADLLVAPIRRLKAELKEKLVLTANGQPAQDIEVMGGGDAVLSALIASWLGISQLGYALLLGFLFGALMGAVYLLIELYQTNMLRSCVKRIIGGVLIGMGLMFFFLFNISRIASEPIPAATWIGSLAVAALLGALLGVITSGRRAAKPFPFGPALAMGAFVAIFHNPFGKLGAGGA